MSEIYVYSDGACSGNPGPGGWGYHFDINGKDYENSGSNDDTTNNRMEMTAFLEAMKHVNRLKSTRGKSVIFCTDSKTIIVNSLVKGTGGVIKFVDNKPKFTGYMNTWLKNNWKTSSKDPVKNQDLWQEILEQISKCNKRGIKISIQYIPREKNARADTLAKDAVPN